ncbi:MAG: DNA starvation/stationary phase protection protein [Actinobacteria bacterium]|nr:MAG: DNA starvation/stationary phase protection protein [Actinomycetota bacterium]
MMITQAAMHDARSLHSDVREVGEALQEVLVDLVDLSLLGKHAHWNVEGATFHSLHLQLDELVDEWRALSDDVAERAATLGFAPDAQAATVARDSRIDAFPAGRISDRDLVVGLTDRLGDVIDRARLAMGEAAVRDSISEDLLIEVVKTLEKQHWMLRAQREPA